MIDTGKTVQVHYKGTLADGSVFDTSEGREPLEFKIGEQVVIPGFEAAIVEMEVGETKSVTIPSDDAYGERRDQMVGLVPRDSIPAEIELEIGMVLQMESEQGAMPVRVIAIEDENVTMDANHPLAGEDLTFELTLVAVS